MAAENERLLLRSIEFTPFGEKPFQLKDCIAKVFDDSAAVEPDIALRVEASRSGSIPTLRVGQVGTLTGCEVDPEGEHDGILHSFNNAEVVACDEGNGTVIFTLSSSDGVTYPRSFSVP